MKEARCSLANVMRVRPGTSKGITDLLLPRTPVRFDTNCASEKSLSCDQEDERTAHNKKNENERCLKPLTPLFLLQVKSPSAFEP